MKKIYLFFIALLSLVLILTSCNRTRRITSVAPMLTPMPDIVIHENEISSKSSSETKQTEAIPVDSALSQAFEKLREEALNLVPQDEGLAQQLYRKLINYDGDTIILAKILPNVNAKPTNSDEDESTLPGSSHIIIIAAETYKLNEGVLEETGYAVAPILITADEETNLLEKVFIPEMHDPQKRAEDIKKIFGVEKEEDLGLAYDDILYLEYKNNLAETKYEIALAGGFDGFQSAVVRMLGLLEREFENTSEVDAAIREYFVRNTFSYNSFTVPIWHELGREETDTWVKLYTVMYFGEIRIGHDSEPETVIRAVPVVIEAKFADDAWHVKIPIIIDADGQALIDGVNENFGEYADDCLHFNGTQEAGELVQELERIQNSLIDGTFITGD